MRLVKRVLLMTACLAVGLAVAGASNALSLLDLVGGATFDAGNGSSFSNFTVKLKGKGLSDDLADYEIVSTADGFQLVGDFNETPKGGRIKLTYDVTATELTAAGLAIDPGTGSYGKLKAYKKIKNGRKNAAKLNVALKSGNTTDSEALDSLTSLSVIEKIQIKGDYFLAGSGSSVTNSFTQTPEPATALMLAAGLAGLAVAGRRRPR